MIFKYGIQQQIRMKGIMTKEGGSMLFKYSIRQQIRMKGSSIACFLLIVISVAFLISGVNLVKISSTNLQLYEDVFTTMGLVNQTEDSIQINKYWDAGEKQYTLWDTPVFSSILPESVLDMEQVEYIIAPSQRPYYLADVTGFVVESSDNMERYTRAFGELVIFEPEEDCVPIEPYRVNIVETLWNQYVPGNYRWFCDHLTEFPAPLKKGKQYISFLSTYELMHTDANPSAYSETYPSKNQTTSSQVTRQGEPLYHDESTSRWDEITEDFYESETWSRWQASVEAIERFLASVPVVPTDHTQLLLPFHQGDAYIRDGRDIMKSEYDEGSLVCLLPYKFATLNQLKVGDSIDLPLYLADYKNPASKVLIPSTSLESGGFILQYSLLNAQGEAYPVFDRQTYEIVGIYGQEGHQGMQTSGFELPNNGIIIPSKAVKGSDENNIVAVGPMQAQTTSFQIPNGATKQYMDAFAALNIFNLEITFYDGGYEQLREGMENLKTVGNILAVAGGAMVLAVLFFFAFYFTSKQRRRTAIERSLGVSKSQCMVSLFYGIQLVTIPGVIAGVILGQLATSGILQQITGNDREIFSTVFSSWVNTADAIVNTELIAASPWIAVLLGVLVLGLSLLTSLLIIRNSLKAEPLTILSKRDA